MSKLFLIIAAVNGFLAVALGAFGAHGLKGKLSESLLSAYETGVQYHFYHVFALMAVALLFDKLKHTALLQVSAYLYCAGIVLFCGSLYLLALGGPRWLGPLTPLGGITFLAAWAMLLVALVRG